MKVGTDGVLLGAWADLGTSKTILDIGTGSGLIALMVAQRNKNATIDAIEIDEDSFNQAVENVQISKWKTSIKVYHSSIQTFKPGKMYDTIISNPPYFSNGPDPVSTVRKKARNSRYLTKDDLIKSVNSLLLPDGAFNLIYPFLEGEQFINIAQENGLFLQKKVIIRSRKEMKPERLLLKFLKTKTKTEISELIIYQSGVEQKLYTEDYISLMKDFYLYM